ncbi:Growth factor receptor-bound protein 2 [Desmophyllum pertusum]|uniref:Growth factor receptor-bound protein 2 n=1 Tax=Desmophyllum pertusum TaxID=174260 RepID=A0A9W9YG30_9CNID|nr:Growth factor receptor-bound protein 2 [Desmophyllum pertusum]
MEAVAKFMFAASQEDELSFEKGSVLNVLDKDEDKNWYKAELGDRDGWIPCTYISMKPHSWFHGKITRKQAEEALLQLQFEGAFLIRESESSPGDFSLSVRTGDNVQHFKIFKDDDRKYHLWIRKFSSLNLLVEHHKTNSVSKTQEIFLNEVDFRDEMVQALFTFTAQDNDELSFVAGDWITVLDKSNPNWWKGQVHGSIGIFPANYVSPPTQNTT